MWLPTQWFILFSQSGPWWQESTESPLFPLEHRWDCGLLNALHTSLDMRAAWDRWWLHPSAHPHTPARALVESLQAEQHTGGLCTFPVKGRAAWNIHLHSVYTWSSCKPLTCDARGSSLFALRFGFLSLGRARCPDCFVFRPFINPPYITPDRVTAVCWQDPLASKHQMHDVPIKLDTCFSFPGIDFPHASQHISWEEREREKKKKPVSAICKISIAGAPNSLLKFYSLNLRGFWHWSSSRRRFERLITTCQLKYLLTNKTARPATYIKIGTEITSRRPFKIT